VSAGSEVGSWLARKSCSWTCSAMPSFAGAVLCGSEGSKEGFEAVLS
jgi:hypothetical protein